MDAIADVTMTGAEPDAKLGSSVARIADTNRRRLRRLGRRRAARRRRRQRDRGRRGPRPRVLLLRKLHAGRRRGRHLHRAGDRIAVRVRGGFGRRPQQRRRGGHRGRRAVRRRRRQRDRGRRRPRPRVRVLRRQRSRRGSGPDPHRRRGRRGVRNRRGCWSSTSAATTSTISWSARRSTTRVARPGADRGEAYVFFGGSTPDAVADVTISGGTDDGSLRRLGQPRGRRRTATASGTSSWAPRWRIPRRERTPAAPISSSAVPAVDGDPRSRLRRRRGGRQVRRDAWPVRATSTAAAAISSSARRSTTRTATRATTGSTAAACSCSSAVAALDNAADATVDGAQDDGLAGSRDRQLSGARSQRKASS